MGTDNRLNRVSAAEKVTLSEIEKAYGGLQDEQNAIYDEQIQAQRDWYEEQKKYQQKQSDLSIHQMEYDKGQVTKDYQKEQSASYVDYQKAINPYGVNAEQAAAAGMANSGFSESSKVRAYTAYQNRVAVARESYQAAVHNYNIAMEQARLQNSYALAQIAYQAQQMELEIAMQKAISSQELIIDKTKTELQVKDMYHGQYMDVLQQINTENALAENKRQFNAEMDFKNKQFAWQQAQAAKASSGGGGGGSSRSSRSSSSKKSSKKSSSSNKIKKSGNTQTIKSTQNKKSSEPTPDMSSVLSLGYGPISASRLNQLIKEGKVKETEKNGKLYYTKRFNY